MDLSLHELPMISGSHEAQIRTYRRADCSRGVWLISTSDPNSADHLYFHNPKDKNSDGFGGRTIVFKLDDGSEYHAKGPWKAGHGGLLKDTGIDLSDKYHSRVVISKGVRHDKSPTCSWASICVLTDVVYQEADFTVGQWDRWKEILNALPAGEYYVYREGYGSSTRGMEKSDGSRFSQNGTAQHE